MAWPLPVRGDIDLSTANDCMQKGLKLLAENKLVPDTNQLLTPDTTSQINDLFAEFFADASITPEDASGNYLHYGVREFGMGAVMNGIGLHGGDDAVHRVDRVEIVRGDDDRPVRVLQGRGEAAADHVAEHVEDHDVGVLEQVMLLQQSINFKKNKALVGTTQRVLIDMCNDQGTSLGRTYRDSPEIDNYVKIKEKIEPGTFCDIKITKAMEYDLIGEVC